METSFGTRLDVTEQLRVPEEQLTPELVFSLMHKQQQGAGQSGADQKSKPIVTVKLGNDT